MNYASRQLMNNRKINRILDQMEWERESDMKRICSHPYAEWVYDTDSNGGQVAMCLHCHEDVTHLLPENN